MDGNVAMDKLNYVQILAIIGGILGIIAIFLGWFDFEGSKITGLEFITDETYRGWGYESYMPLLATVMVVIGLIVSIISIFKPKAIKYSSIILILLGILGIIFVMIFYTWSIVDLGVIFKLKISDFAGIGIWIEIIACLLVIICGIADLFISRKAEPESL